MMDKKYEWSMAHKSKEHPYPHVDLHLRDNLGDVVTRVDGFPCKDERVEGFIRKALESLGISPSDINDPSGCSPHL